MAVNGTKDPAEGTIGVTSRNGGNKIKAISLCYTFFRVLSELSDPSWELFPRLLFGGNTIRFTLLPYECQRPREYHSNQR
jgi:hypothetical protein